MKALTFLFPERGIFQNTQYSRIVGTATTVATTATATATNAVTSVLMEYSTTQEVLRRQEELSGNLLSTLVLLTGRQ